MAFKEVVDATPNLNGKWCAGLGALRAEDRPHVQPEDTSTARLRGSVDVDAALLQQEPNAHRWDFAIGYQHANRKKEFIYWVEIHSGNDSQVKVVLAKLTWLKGWLKTEGKELAKFDKRFIWTPSGATSLTKGSTQIRKLAEQGLIYSGKVFRICLNHEQST